MIRSPQLIRMRHRVHYLIANAIQEQREELEMKAASLDPLTGVPKGVRLDESVSVSVSEPEADLASPKGKGSEAAPQISSEVRDGS